jgi:hypothetical protein
MLAVSWRSPQAYRRRWSRLLSRRRGETTPGPAHGLARTDDIGGALREFVAGLRPAPARPGCRGVRVHPFTAVVFIPSDGTRDDYYYDEPRVDRAGPGATTARPDAEGDREGPRLAARGGGSAGQGRRRDAAEKGSPARGLLGESGLGGQAHRGRPCRLAWCRCHGGLPEHIPALRSRRRCSGRPAH